MHYRPKDYWEERLKHNFSLGGAGHSGFSLRYNRYLYQLKASKLSQALKRHKIETRGAEVLDIGSGTGFFVGYYLKKGARVCGVDITETSIANLKDEYPGQNFYRIDIGREPYPREDKFDIVNIFDVLYHITEEQGFKTALKNIGLASKPGAWVLITDSLNPGLNQAGHVCFRRLDEYRDTLEDEGIEIIEIIPVFNFLGRSFSGYARNQALARILAFLSELSGLPSYWLDRIYCPLKGSTLKLLICRKR